MKIKYKVDYNPNNTEISRLSSVIIDGKNQSSKFDLGKEFNDNDDSKTEIRQYIADTLGVPLNTITFI